LSAGGWLGGSLIYHNGIAVDDERLPLEERLLAAP
jgi:hypothetical protein